MVTKKTDSDRRKELAGSARDYAQKALAALVTIDSSAVEAEQLPAFLTVARYELESALDLVRVAQAPAGVIPPSVRDRDSEAPEKAGDRMTERQRAQCLPKPDESLLDGLGVPAPAFGFAPPEHVILTPVEAAQRRMLTRSDCQSIPRPTPADLAGAPRSSD